MRIRKAAVLEVEEAVNNIANRDRFAPPGQYINCALFYAVNDGRNIALTAGCGVMMFCPRDDSTYEVHFAFTPPMAGKVLLDVAREMLEHVFTHYGASAIVGLPPRENRAVRTIGYLLGFRPTGTVTTDRLGRECIEYKLERENG